MRTVITLVCSGAPLALRAGRFPNDDELDSSHYSDLSFSLAGQGWNSQAVICSPSLAARQTAQMMGIENYQLEPALKEVDYGLWAGSSLKDIEPQTLGLWLQDPCMRPPNGESLEMVWQRAASWFDAFQNLQGELLVITHANLIKALALRLLGAPLAAMFTLNIAPLSQTKLSCHRGRWQLQCMGAELKS